MSDKSKIEELQRFVFFLHENGYSEIKLFNENKNWAGIVKFMFTHAIITGKVGDTMCYENRWCYHTEEKAASALAAWDGQNEPTGWHRHPDTGRRYDEAGEMYVNS